MWNDGRHLVCLWARLVVSALNSWGGVTPVEPQDSGLCEVSPELDALVIVVERNKIKVMHYRIERLVFGF